MGEAFLCQRDWLSLSWLRGIAAGPLLLNGPIRFFDKFNKNVATVGYNQGNLINFSAALLEF
jgi:hypothetical protein